MVEESAVTLNEEKRNLFYTLNQMGKNMQLPSFKGGIHPPHYKSETEHKAIVVCPLPEKIVLPLSQHIGAPCKSLVEVGQQVKAGQKIAESESFLSAPIHASVSGIIDSIAPHPHFTGSDITSITIIPDRKQESITFPGDRQSGKRAHRKVKIHNQRGRYCGHGRGRFPYLCQAVPAKRQAD